MIYNLLFFSFISFTTTGVRDVSSTSCDITTVKLAVGLTTQIIFEQEPRLILHADDTHFKVSTNKFSPRSLAIIPHLENSEINQFGKPNDPKKLAESLNKHLKTNLFVFFDGTNQLMFELKFAPKNEADYVLKMTQKFDKGCSL